jgi:hypothetical protein
MRKPYNFEDFIDPRTRKPCGPDNPVQMRSPCAQPMRSRSVKYGANGRQRIGKLGVWHAIDQRSA